MRKTPEIVLSFVLKTLSQLNGTIHVIVKVMPSFDQNFIEKLREERVSNAEFLPKNHPLPRSAIETALNICDNDLVEEFRRLACAQAQVKKSQHNIKSLKKKRERIIKRMTETD
jgi:hypothetical protein